MEYLLRHLRSWYYKIQIRQLEKKYSCKLQFILQGSGTLTIVGPRKNFQIHETSHLKSNTYIECEGGVTIGRYFHVGRSLTVLSSNHNYDSSTSIPYDRQLVKKPVVIGDFVWCGSNVTILPGVVLGEGVVVGAGSVVTKSFAPGTVIGGNPAKPLKQRNMEEFERLKKEGHFF